MPASKLKNLVILILVLANAFLLLLAVPLRAQRSQEEAAAAAQLQSLFARCGVSLDPAAMPESRTLYTLEFSPDEDAALPAMQALLGEMVFIEEDSTRYLTTYRSEQGACRLSRNGALSARLTGRAAAGDLSRAAEEELTNMGVELAYVDQPQRSSAGVYSVTAVQKLLEVPVFSAAATLTFHNGVPGRLAGTLYFDTENLFRTDDLPCITCADALVVFLDSRDELGWVGAAVTELTQGYLRAETASAAVVRLTPGWRIATDAGAYWVNGMTREVTAFPAP